MMYKKQKALELLLAQKLLPLYYHESADVSIAILKAMYEAGIRLVEYTNRGNNALTNFSSLKQVVDESMPDLLLGIGTVKNSFTALEYIKAGADFIVAPSINVEVAKVTHEAGLLWIPGCMTPTEIATAENAGAAIVKIFPGNLLGPSYILSIKELFPGLLLMPTGGVEAEESNLSEWFDSGVVAVGMGSKLIAKKHINSGNYKGITETIVNAWALIKKVADTRR